MTERRVFVLAVLAMIVAPISAQQKSRADTRLLILADQGSFFVGGESKRLPPTPPAPSDPPVVQRLAADPGEITVNQMYVQYQVPQQAGLHVPVVMVHGCCLSSKTWETTTDGRMGWSEYFVRKGRAVHLADQVSRARSGFDPTIFSAVRAGAATPAH